MATVTERVDAGIRLLDEHRPDWRESIDLDRLNLESLENCVLAQIFVTFGAGLRILNIAGDPARECGFDIYGSFRENRLRDDSFANLEAEWRRRLQ